MTPRPPTSAQLDWIERRARAAKWHLRKREWDEFDRIDQDVAHSSFKALLNGYDNAPLLGLWWQLMSSERSRKERAA